MRAAILPSPARRHAPKAGMIAAARNSLSGESPAARPERRRRNFRPETLRHMNGRRREVGLRGASGERWTHPASTHRRGAARLTRLISQVTGQKGGRRASRYKRLPRCFCRDCLSGVEARGKTDPAIPAAPGARRPHRRLRRLGHAGAVQLADRRAPRGAPRRGRVRRLAHVRHRPQGRAGARLPARSCSPTTSAKLKTPGKALYSCLLNERGRRAR